MKLSDFDFDLPEELIAQNPPEVRGDSRLLVVSSDGEYTTSHFSHISNFLKEGDLLVFNDSKVIKAKLSLHKDASVIDLNLNRPVTDNIWHGFTRPYKKLEEGDEFTFGDHVIAITKKLGMGEVEVEFRLAGGASSLEDIYDFLDIYGEIPLPPYIKRLAPDVLDEDRYQTVYSDAPGSVAAPTAGLHFTDGLLFDLHKKNIEMAFVTLHVGAGTFLPVKTEDIKDHKMHYESYFLDQEAADKINKAKAEGRRVIAVGTTSMRVLESAALKGKLQQDQGETNLFIVPGFEFKIVDALITNFHLPKSTLLMLISAFAGYDRMKEAYQFAINNRFRFFSYGDAMFLEKEKL